MLNTVKEKAVSTKNHIVRHRAKYAAATTVVVCFSAHRLIVKEWYAFLEEKGIDPMEFLCPEYFEELNS